MIFNIEVGMKNITASLDPSFPADVTVNTGGQATFKVVVTDEGIPKEHTFQWYVNGNAVEGATADTYIRDTSGDKGVISVWCEVTNKAGSAVSRKATLTVNKLPVLNASYPANASVLIARSATFYVSTAEHGYPTNYSFQWYLNGAEVPGATASTYTCTGTGVGTAYIYCVVSNAAGSVQSRTASFTISSEMIVQNGAFVDGGSWGSYCYDEDSWVKQESWALHILGDGSGSNRAWSNQLYDFTGKNKLIFYCAQFGVTDDDDLGTFYFGATDDTEDGFVAYTAVTACNSGAAYITVDVSQISGYHRIKVCLIRNCSHQDYVYVQNVYFE